MMLFRHIKIILSNQEVIESRPTMQLFRTSFPPFNHQKNQGEPSRRHECQSSCPPSRRTNAVTHFRSGFPPALYRSVRLYVSRMCTRSANSCRRIGSWLSRSIIAEEASGQTTDARSFLSFFQTCSTSSGSAVAECTLY